MYLYVFFLPIIHLLVIFFSPCCLLTLLFRFHPLYLKNQRGNSTGWSINCLSTEHIAQIALDPCRHAKARGAGPRESRVAASGPRSRSPKTYFCVIPSPLWLSFIFLFCFNVVVGCGLLLEYSTRGRTEQCGQHQQLAAHQLVHTLLAAPGQLLLNTGLTDRASVALCYHHLARLPAGRRTKHAPKHGSHNYQLQTEYVGRSSEQDEP